MDTTAPTLAAVPLASGRGVGPIFLQPVSGPGCWVAGWLILTGLAVAGWRIALAGLLGSVVGSLTELATGASLTTLDHGLWGYSPCLTAIACVTLLRASRLRWVLAVVGAAVTVGVEELLAHATPVPVYTWPFILVTWAILAVVGYERV